MMNRRAFSAGEKRLLLFCLFVIGLPLSVALFFGHINATPVVSIPPPPTLPKPNGYDLYVAAAKAMTRAKPEVDPISDKTALTDPKVRAQRYSLARRTAWLNQNRKAFALFNQAQKTPFLAPPARSFDPRFPDNVKLRQLARDKSAQSNTLWMRGDFHGAFEVNLDTIQMGHDVRHGGNLLAALVGIAISAIGRANTGDTIERLNAAQCKSAARRLEKMLATRWKLDQNLTEDKWALQAGLIERFEDNDWRDSFGPGKTSLLKFLRIHTISKQQLIDGIGATYDHAIANARLSYAKQVLLPAHLSDPFSEVLVGVLNRARFNDARDLAGDHSLMLQLALRAYRLENGVYPASLNALRPKYLNAMPADPFGGGEPWRYKVRGQTYLLWSIGPDGVDNGGTPIVPKNAPPRRFAGERVKLPNVLPDSRGDYVAGKNG